MNYKRACITVAITFLLFAMAASASIAQRQFTERKAQTSRSNQDGQRGVIYEIRDHATGKVYIGQALSHEHLMEREASYIKRQDRAGGYDIRVIEEPKRGNLRVREEYHLRNAIAEHGRDMVENKYSAMRADKYEEAVRQHASETPAQRRARLEKFEKERYERGKKADIRREKREGRKRAAERRIEQMRESQRRERERERTPM